MRKGSFEAKHVPDCVAKKHNWSRFFKWESIHLLQLGGNFSSQVQFWLFRRQNCAHPGQSRIASSKLCWNCIFRLARSVSLIGGVRLVGSISAGTNTRIFFRHWTSAASFVEFSSDYAWWDKGIWNRRSILIGLWRDNDNLGSFIWVFIFSIKAAQSLEAGKGHFCSVFVGQAVKKTCHNLHSCAALVPKATR